MRSRPVAERPRGRSPGLILGLALAAVLSCAGEPSPEHRLVVHAPLPLGLLAQVEEAFEAEHPTIDVTMVGATVDETLAALRSDTATVDVWWGAPSTALARAAREGLLQPYRPSWLERSSSEERGEGDLWQTTLVSPFVIAFNRESVPLMRAPRDWIDLFHLRWAGEVTIADPGRNEDGAHFVAAMLLESLREDGSLVGGFDWLRRLDEVVGTYASDHAEVIDMLGRGRASIGIVPRHVVEAARHDVAPWIHYRLPESGTPVLSRGIAVAARAPAPEIARQFVDLAGATEVATAARLATRWTSVHADLDMERFPSDFEIDLPWTPYPLATDTIAAEIDGWIERWEREVRGLRGG